MNDPLWLGPTMGRSGRYSDALTFYEETRLYEAQLLAEELVFFSRANSRWVHPADVPGEENMAAAMDDCEASLHHLRDASIYFWPDDLENFILAAAREVPSEGALELHLPAAKSFFTLQNGPLVAIGAGMTGVLQAILAVWEKREEEDGVRVTPYLEGLGGQASFWWPASATIADLVPSSLAEDDTDVETPARILLTASYFLTTLLVAEPHEAARAERRRYEREYGQSCPLIQVTRLRRVERPHSDRDVQERNWHYQWLVSGHWRNQWYATADLHRLRWIAPYVKGPDGKPLRPKVKRLFEVVR